MGTNPQKLYEGCDLGLLLEMLLSDKKKKNSLASSSKRVDAACLSWPLVLGRPPHQLADTTARLHASVLLLRR